MNHLGRFSVSCILLAGWLQASTVEAHFVWIQADPAESEWLIRAGFGEFDGWDPDLIDRIRTTEFRKRTAGKVTPLKVTVDSDADEYRARTDLATGDGLLAECDFGVVQLGGGPPVWLRYTAKHRVGDFASWKPDEATPGARIEVLATVVDPASLRLKVPYLGKPLADAKIKATTPSGARAELTTDAGGQAVWTLSETGLHGCYVGTTTPQSGTRDGRNYEAQKDYATFSFRRPP